MTQTGETLNINSTRRLGVIERSIMMWLAAYTFDNQLIYRLAGNDPRDHYHSNDMLARNTLYEACGGDLSHLSTRSAVSAFGRALHSLLNKGLINGKALAWCLVEKTPEGGWKWDERQDWAGYGRPRKTKEGYKDKTPVLKRVGLTELGWAEVRKTEPEIGYCHLCKQILADDGETT